MIPETPIRLYYWRGTGPIGALVRHATSSQWDHVAVSVVIDGALCYFESMPGSGFRVVPINGDAPPNAVQETGLCWSPGKVALVLFQLSRRGYSLLNGVLAAFGVKRKSWRMQCANSAIEVLRIAGLNLDIVAEPQQLANAVEAATGHPVRLLLTH